MFQCVLRLRNYLNVLGAVIVFDSIDVMNLFPGKQATPNLYFRYNAMLICVSANISQMMANTNTKQHVSI